LGSLAAKMYFINVRMDQGCGLRAEAFSSSYFASSGNVGKFEVQKA
jgi:hypothetical protein